MAGREEELREQENILYVAMTRARELLLLAFGMEMLYAIGWGDGEGFDEELPPAISLPQVEQESSQNASSRSLEIRPEQILGLFGRISDMLEELTAEVEKLKRALGPLVERSSSSPLKPSTKTEEVSREEPQPHHETDAESQKASILSLAEDIAPHDPQERSPSRLAEIMGNRVRDLGPELGEKYLDTLASMTPNQAAQVFARSSKVWIGYLETGKWPRWRVAEKK
jgi:hypothetical protein